MKALRIYAGPSAKALLAQNGLQASQIKLIPGAAGGPKGLILGPLDRFIFGEWLATSQHPVHLLGASIGAWRMATACLDAPVAALQRLEHDYIHQHYEPLPGKKRPTAVQVSTAFAQSLQSFFGGKEAQVLHHSRYRLHIIAARGRHILRREHGLATPLGYLGAFLSNAVHRKALGAWLERVVFSSPGLGQGTAWPPLPFPALDFRTRHLPLSAANFAPALQASCSIPFALRAVDHIPGAPPGAYWDGGITDYHLHLDYRALCGGDQANGLVLYPHFQKSIVPGWLDKALKHRHASSSFLDHVVVLAPDPGWVKTLPNGKLPDRKDFTHYGNDLPGRIKAWRRATSEAQRLVDEFQAWLVVPDMGRVEAL